MKNRLTSSVISVILVLAVAGTVALAAGQWPTFRHDGQRTGLADAGALSVNSPSPIWIFPKPAASTSLMLDDDGTVTPNTGTAAVTFAPVASWTSLDGTTAQTPTNAQNNNVHIADTDASGASTAVYVFTPGAGGYNVSAYIPSQGTIAKPFSQDARYTVEVQYLVGATWTTRTTSTATIDQSVGDGWMLLTTNGGVGVGAGERIKVTLSSMTTVSGDAGRTVVVADSIRLDSPTGAVLSSPILSPTQNILLTGVTETRFLDQVFTLKDDGTGNLVRVPVVDPVTGAAPQPLSRSVGRVYAVNTENDATTAWDDRGRHAWLKPGATLANVDNPDQWLPFPEDANDWISGPLGVGLSSSATIVTFNGEECAAIPAGDGQVYMIRTTPTLGAGQTRLVWQGPGFLVDDASALTPTYTGAWDAPQTGPGRQGAEYHRVLVTQASTATAAWTATVTKGVYTAYAWIPPNTDTELHASNAHYVVKIGATVGFDGRIDQRAGGQWIRLGAQYSANAGDITVTLSNDFGSAPPANPPTQPTPYVVADAVKIVPGDLSAFDLSSPAVDANGDIYVAGVNGRVYKLKIGQQLPVWTFPDPNVSPTIADSTNDQYPAPNAVGAFYASPTLSSDGNTVYIGSSDGRVYALNTSDGHRKWRYPADAQHLAQISSTAAVGGHIVVAIGPGKSDFTNAGVAVDTAGRVVALTDNGGSATAAWWYPALGLVNVGAFNNSSPLLMNINGDDQVFIGSHDGLFYGMHSNTGAGLVETNMWGAYTQLFGAINSSPAGAYYGIGAGLPHAIVGSDAARLSTINLTTGVEDWFYTLFGSVTSSPAVANDRFYAGDLGGYTWGFSTRIGAGGAGTTEDWNTEIDPGGPPSGGSNGGGRVGHPEIDVFSKAQYDAFPGWGATIPLTDWHKQTGTPDRTYEWGDTIYVIVWNELGPNSALTLKLRSQAPGSDAGSEDRVQVPAGNSGIVLLQDGSHVHYTRYAYRVYGGSEGKSGTPGDAISMWVEEKPGNPADVMGTNFVPDSPGAVKQALFTVNNPLGLFVNGAPIGVDGTPGNLTSTRTNALAKTNGNATAVPTLWCGTGPFVMPTSHGSTSDPMRFFMIDRSRLAPGAGRTLRKVRVQRSDLLWTGGLGSVLAPLPWEDLPNQPVGGTADYPDISLRQELCSVEGTGIDPTQISVALAGAGGAADATTWPVAPTNTTMRVSVPRYQPANLSGYYGRTYVYIDSNGNGRLDRVGLGSGAILGGGANEAYREFDTAAKVMPDRRVEIAEKTLDVGQVPHGFGMINENNAPVAFYPYLTDNYLTSWNAAPNPGFKEWWVPFTAYNTGNINILNLRVYSMGLRSDSVQDYYIPGTHYPSGDPIPRNQGACVVSALDPTFWTSTRPQDQIWQSEYPTLQGQPRTFHKARVGEDAPVLKVPDQPQGYSGTNPAERAAISVAVPIGQPVGTYTGKFTFFEDINGDGKFYQNLDNPFDPGNIAFAAKIAGNPVATLAVTVSEDRLTGSSAPGSAPHVDPGNPNAAPSISNTNPAVFRDPNDNNLYSVWPSNRHASDILNRTGVAQTPTDPWFLYMSTMPFNMPVQGTADSGWRFKMSNPVQWWTPTSYTDNTLAQPYPSPAVTLSGNQNTIFPSYSPGNPYVGAPGDTVPNSVRYYSPSVAVDRVTETSSGDRKAMLFFLGHQYKNWMNPNDNNDQRRVPEYRAFYTDVTRGSLTNNINLITFDWTMPKYGLKGIFSDRVLAPGANPSPWLWAFWYGGNNNKWNIYYTANPQPINSSGQSVPDAWAREAKLGVATGLTTVSDPSPIYRPQIGPVETNDFIDVVYSGFSSFYKNSDIYLSHYKAGVAPARQQNVDLQSRDLYLRGANIFFSVQQNKWDTTSFDEPNMIAYSGLSRDMVKGVWYSKDVDWDPRRRNGWPAGFRVFLFLDRTDLNKANSCYEITTGAYTRDANTGVFAYAYSGGSPAEIELRRLVRGAVVDPTSGTVKLIRAPGKNSLVAATYMPRAFRLTWDAAADTSPFAFMDNGFNKRYTLDGQNKPTDGNPFFTDPNNTKWDASIPPRQDRLWVFWRRPGVSNSGVGIHYKTYRYTVPLRSQIALDAKRKPTITSITGIDWPINQPVEVDWVKNRLYFTSYEEGNRVQVEYTDSKGNTAKMVAAVELAEELSPGQQGTVFGNLTQVMMNEGQISAYKDEDPTDPLRRSGKIWVFWTSTRSGNSDVYYEAISPKFYGNEY